MLSFSFCLVSILLCCNQGVNFWKPEAFVHSGVNMYVESGRCMYVPVQWYMVKLTCCAQFADLVHCFNTNYATPKERIIRHIRTNDKKHKTYINGSWIYHKKIMSKCIIFTANWFDFIFICIFFRGLLGIFNNAHLVWVYVIDANAEIVR